MLCSCFYNIVYFCVISYKPLSILRIPHSPLINLFHTLAFPTPKHVTSPTPVTTTRRIGTKRVDIVIPFSFVLLYHRILEVINEYKLILFKEWKNICIFWIFSLEINRRSVTKETDEDTTSKDEKWIGFYFIFMRCLEFYCIFGI